MRDDGWREILEFPGYAVSLDGRVHNLRTGREMVLTKNRQNISYVGLMRDGRQFQRAVALLVAKAFLNPPQRSDFTTPINTDGDRSNNYYKNLRWRTRGFAINYHLQFKPNARLEIFPDPIEDFDTGDEYENSWPAAVTYGLLVSHVTIFVRNNHLDQYIWPEGKRFRKIRRRFDYDGNVIPHILKNTY